MPTAVRVGAQIAAKCEKLQDAGLDWKVERGNGRQDWVYRITTPKGTRVQIHSSPSDRNWQKTVQRDLDDGGFQEDWARLTKMRADDRRQRLSAAKRQETVGLERAAKQAAAVEKAAGQYAGPREVDLGWLLTPSQWPETKIVIITPEAARKILDEVNVHNRPLRQGRVPHLVQIIKDGEWGATHQGGAIDNTGVLQDGQHRLEAIYQAGVAVPMMWSIGMPPEYFKKVDTGSNRSARDTAVIRGEEDPATIAATVKMLVILDMFGPDAHVRFKSYRVTNDRVDRTIEAMGDDLRDAVRDAKAIKREIKKVNPSALATAIYLIRKRLPKGDPRVEAFLADLKYGEGIMRGDPVWHLRRLLLNNMDARRGYNQWETLAYIIKTWNHRAKGNQSMQQLVWRPANEPFPANIFLPPPLQEDQSQAALIDAA